MISALLAIVVTFSSLADVCDRADLRAGSADGNRGTMRRISHDDDDRRQRRSLQVVVPGRCLEASLQGRVEFAADERTVTAVAPGGHASFRERLPGSDREVRFTADGGRLVARARRDGREVALDEDMRDWLAHLLPDVLAEMAIEVPRRVARLHEAGGVRGVLDLVERLGSSSARRAHYEALLARPLGAGDLESVARHATRHLPSSGDLTTVARLLPAERMRTEGGRRAIAETLARIASSGDRTEALIHHARTADADLLAALAPVARSVPSSGDKSEFLEASAPSYLTSRNAALREAWFDVAATVPSSGDLRDLLTASLRHLKGDPEGVQRVIEIAARHVASSGDRSDVLLDVIGRGLLTTPALRQALRDAARTIPSSGDYRRVMEALADR